MSSMGDLFITVGAKIDGFKSAMTQVNSGLDTVARKSTETAATVGAAFSRIGASLEPVGAQFQKFGTTLSVAVTAPLVGLGVAALKTAGELEQNTIAFTTMMKSADAAGDHLRELKEFALKTPFEFRDLVLASKRMQALGFEGRQVIPILTNIGDAASALGMGAEGIQRIVTAIGQMKAKGMVQAEEMRQLAEAGIPAWQILAKTLNTDVAGAMKMVEKRTVEASVAIPAILAGMNEKFGGLMKQQAETLLGQFSNLKDAINFTLQDIGKTLAPTAKSMMENIIKPMLETFKDLAAAFAALPSGMQSTVIAFAALAAAAGPALYAIGGITSGMGSLIGIAGALPALLNPITLAIVALGAAAGIAAFEFSRNTAKMSSLNQAYSEWLTKQVKTTTDFAKTHDVLTESLERGVIGLSDYTQALAILEDREKKAIGGSMKQTGLKVLGWDGSKMTEASPAKSEELGKVKDHFKPFTDTSDSIAILIAQYQQATAAHKALIDEIAKSGLTIDAFFAKKVDEAEGSLGLFNRGIEKTTTDMIDAYAPVKKLSETMDEFAEATLKAQKKALETSPFGKLADAAKYFGITTRQELEQTAKVSQEKYEQMKKTGIASDRDLTMAYLMMLQDMANADRAFGRISNEVWEKITDDISAQLEKIDDKHKQSAEKRKKIERSIGEQLAGEWKGIFEGFERDLASNIIHWKGWSDSLKRLADGLATSMLSAFFKGLFKPMEDQLAKLGAKIGDVFGKIWGSGGSSAASAAGGIGSAAGGAASVGGGIAKGVGQAAGSAVTGVVGAVAGVVGAISSVIGNFQMAGMNKSLDIIVKHTLQTANDLFNLRRDEWDRETHLMLKLDDMWNEIRNVVTAIRGGGPVVAGVGGGVNFNFTNVTFSGGASASQLRTELAALVREMVASGDL